MTIGPAPLKEVGTGARPSPNSPVTIFPGVVRVTAPNPSMMTGPGTNTYVVGSDTVVVIDPGPDERTHRTRLIDVIDGRAVTAVVVTHTHPDHAPGAAKLASVVGAATMGFGPGPEFEPDVLLGDGDRVGQDPFALRVIHTPGHASDHCCYLLGELGLVFTGDHVMEGSTVVIRPLDGDVGAYLSSLERLRSWSPPVRALAPGHGRVIDDPHRAIDDVIDHRVAREAVVLEALGRHEHATARTLRAEVYEDLDRARHDIAEATLWGHLRHLVDGGKAQALDDNDLITCRYRAVGSALPAR